MKIGMLDLIDQMRVSIPEEVKKAQQLLAQRRSASMAQAQEEANRTVNLARDRSANWSSVDQVVQAAYTQAEQRLRPKLTLMVMPSVAKPMNMCLKHCAPSRWRWNVPSTRFAMASAPSRRTNQGILVKFKKNGGEWLRSATHHFFNLGSTPIPASPIKAAHIGEAERRSRPANPSRTGLGNNLVLL